MLSRFLSKKLLAFVLTTIVVPFLAMHGVSESVIHAMILLAGGYLGVQGIVDSAENITRKGIEISKLKD